MFNDDAAHTQIMNTTNPYRIKSIGNNIRNFQLSTWEKECEKEVLNITLAKFQQNDNFKRYLPETGERHIIEATKDLFWGSGKTLRDYDVLDVQRINGKNVMGRCLEAVRATLKKKN